MYYYDLHCHTSNSKDSPADIRRTVRVAKKRGIDGIAVTDHNKIYKGPLRIEGIDIIPGCEITLKGGGHLLSYFVTEDIKPYRGLRETVSDVKAQGGYAVLAHPLCESDGWIRKNEEREINVDEALEIIDGLESGNAFVSNEEMARVSEIAERAGIIQTAGSDIHMSGQVGFVVLAVKERITKANFIEVIRKAEIIVRPEAEIFRKNVRYGKKVATNIVNLLGSYNIEFFRYLFSVLVIKNYFRLKNRKFESIKFNFKEN